MIRLTFTILATFVIATCFTAEVAIAPIWMAPKNLNYPETVTGDFDTWENFTANLGEWATIEVATGARGLRPLSVVDSKGMIWIFAGAINRYVTKLYTAVWNYNPKTDQYRYVWKGTDPSPFVARNAGQLRVPSITNHPGGIRYGTAAIDKDDNIWFYSYEYWGELWMFNTTSWMFVRQFGSASTTARPSIGSNPGQPGEDVWPGYIAGHCLVIDSKNDLWILAGDNYEVVTNTVWHFNMTSYLWTLVTGSVLPEPVENSTYYGGRWMSGCDIDDNDRVWVYGGAEVFGGQIETGNLYSFDTRSKREWQLEYNNVPLNTSAHVVSSDYHPDNQPPEAEAPVLIDRRDGTLMLVPGASNSVWQYSKSLKQWRHVYGNYSLALPGKYTHFRAPGSVMPSHLYLSYSAGKHNGDLYLIGGTKDLNSDSPNRKDIWLIPQDQCSNNIRKCDTNADCIEDMIGYSCQCKGGYTGNGFTCTVIIPPIADHAPMSVPIISASPIAIIPPPIIDPPTTTPIINSSIIDIIPSPPTTPPIDVNAPQHIIAPSYVNEPVSEQGEDLLVDDSERQFPSWAIALIVIGGVLVLSFAVALIVVYQKKRRSQVVIEQDLDLISYTKMSV